MFSKLRNVHKYVTESDKYCLTPIINAVNNTIDGKWTKDDIFSRQRIRMKAAGLDKHVIPTDMHGFNYTFSYVSNSEEMRGSGYKVGYISNTMAGIAIDNRLRKMPAASALVASGAVHAAIIESDTLYWTRCHDLCTMHYDKKTIYARCLKDISWVYNPYMYYPSASHIKNDTYVIFNDVPINCEYKYTVAFPWDGNIAHVSSNHAPFAISHAKYLLKSLQTIHGGDYRYHLSFNSSDSSDNKHSQLEERMSQYMSSRL